MFRNLWYRFGRALVSFLARGILDLSIRTKAPIPQGPVILAANHPSTSDPAILTTLVNEKISVLILDTLFKVPLFGKSLRFCGHIPVVYGKGQEALDKAEALLKSGKSVAIFPEGLISPEGGFHHAHSGLARLALSSGAPVVPVGIHLDQKQLHWVHTQVEGRDEVGAWYFHGPYAMTVGHALQFQGDVQDRERVKEVTNVIMERIISLAGESAARNRLARRMNMMDAMRWLAWIPVRLVRSWSAFATVRVRY